MEKWNLHRRIALATISRVGSKPESLLLGFMVATAFLSMWISNTATTMMMLPIAMAVVNQLSEMAEVQNAKSAAETTTLVRENFGLVLLLGIAYSASIGGIGTIVGSPTTVAFLGFASETFPDQPPIGFVPWSAVCIPIVIVFLPLTWVYLCRFGAELPLSAIKFHGSQNVIQDELKKLGPITPAERLILMVSAGTALLWITRSPINLDWFYYPRLVRAAARPVDGARLYRRDVHGDTALSVACRPTWPRLGEGLRNGLEDRGRTNPLGHRLLARWRFRPGRWNLRQRPGNMDRLAARRAQGYATVAARTDHLLAINDAHRSDIKCCDCADVRTDRRGHGVRSRRASLPSAHPRRDHGFVRFHVAGCDATQRYRFFSSGWITIPKMFRAGIALDVLGLLVVPAMVYFLGAKLFGLDRFRLIDLGVSSPVE